MLPIIAITMGDPAGVGPEVVVKALLRPEIYQCCRPLVIGDAGCLERTVKSCHLKLEIHDLDNIDKAHFQTGAIDVLNLANVNQVELEMGQVSALAGRAAIEYIKTAVALALNKKIDGLTTAPISKAAINAAGFIYAGHTQLLANLTSTSHYAMMLACDKLKITLVTTHIPLAKVAASLTAEKVIETVRLTHKGLQESFGLANPRLALAALNPHAGEGGLFGEEEEEILKPALEFAQREGINISGPYPADTLFVKAVGGKFEAVVCLYHDQGLIPIKLLSFGAAVNVTLGLPIIRTSVDHGTAFDIAGKNKAAPGSLIKAVELAAQMANAKAKRKTGG